MIYLLKTVWRYAKEDKWKILLCYMLHSMSFVGELLKPYAFGRALNELQKNGIENLQSTFNWMSVYVLGFFIFEVFHRLGQYFLVTTSLRNQKRFVDKMYEMVYKLPLKWHSNHHSGGVVSRINVSGKALRDFSFSQRELLENLFLSVGPIIILLTISVEVALISSVLTLINLFVIRKMNKVIERILERQTEKMHSYSAKLIDFVSNIKTIISLNLGAKTRAELKFKFNDYYKETMSEFKVNQVRCFLISFGLIVTELALISYYIWSHKTKGLPIMLGTLGMMVNYFKQMSEAFFRITSNFYELLGWKAHIKSVEPIVNEFEKQDFNKNKKALNKWEKIEIKNLNFDYSKEKANSLDLAKIEQEEVYNQAKLNQTLIGVNLKLRKNSKIAIVGLSGSGKSTLLNMLSGLYKPNSVDVKIDEKKYDNLEVISDTVILANQDAEIFENTIISNITFEEESSEELNKAVYLSRVDEVLEKLPNGLKTDIREKGVNLSGGEKQRIALARALYFSRNKEMLLFDEITSNVDAFNERLIFERLLKEYRNKAVVCTIHRLHLAEMFDEIIVMDKGKIVERGTFKELTKTKGYFKNLWDKYVTSEEKILENRV